MPQESLTVPGRRFSADSTAIALESAQTVRHPITTVKAAANPVALGRAYARLSSVLHHCQPIAKSPQTHAYAR